MSAAQMIAAWDAPVSDPRDVLLLLAVADQAGGDPGGQAQLGTLASRSRSSESDVIERLTRLQVAGLIVGFAIQGGQVRFLDERRVVKEPTPKLLILRRRFARSSIRRRLRAEIAAGMHVCVLCGVDFNLQVDHIVPLSRGGSNHADNLQILCGPCNSGKGSR